MAVPWLTTPGEQLAAMEAGANTGLRRRAQNQEELQAWQHLNLAYNELSAQNFRAAQAEKLRRDEATQSLLQHQQQLDAMKKYHEDSISQRREAAQSLESYRRDTIAKKEQAKSVHVVPGVGLVEYDPDQGAAKVLAPGGYKGGTTFSDSEKVDARDLDRKLVAKDKEIAAAKKVAADALKADPKAETKTTQDSTNALASLEYDKTLLTGTRKSVGKPVEHVPVMGKRAMMDEDSVGSALPYTTGPLKVTTKAQFDALRPGSLYIGEDGKTYRKP